MSPNRTEAAQAVTAGLARSAPSEDEYALKLPIESLQIPSHRSRPSTGHPIDAVPMATFAAPLGKDVDPHAAAPTRRERYWFESWSYPLAGVVYLCVISAILTIMTAIGVALYPAVLKHGTNWINGLFLIVAWGFAMVVVVGHGCRFLDAILQQGLTGGVAEVTAPDRDIDLALASAIRWAVALVNGPLLLLWGALYYWLNCGDLAPLDLLILGELVVPAMTYWLLAVIVLGRKPELGRASLRDVSAMLRKLGLRVLLVGIAATAAAAIHVDLAATSIRSLHQGRITGVLGLGACWCGAWYSAAFTLRVVGLWHYRARRSESTKKNGTKLRASSMPGPNSLSQASPTA